MKSVLFLGIIGLTLSSCVIDDNVVPVIPFKDIVGSFEGLSKICTASNIDVDTLCNAGINNGIKVTIESLNTIKVTDATSQFVNQSLTFIKTDQTSGDKFHFFSAEKDLTILNLQFNERDKSIKFESLVNTDGIIKSDFFIGVKK